MFYSHVNYSVTKIKYDCIEWMESFYSHVNYSVTKMKLPLIDIEWGFTVT